MKRLLFAWVLVAGSAAWGQSWEQLGMHDLSSSGVAGYKGAMTNACLYCHAPHGAMTQQTPLWNQTLSIQTYQLYGAYPEHYHQSGVQPGVGNPSKLCLSCHDGTVAIGQTVLYGQVSMSGQINPSSTLGTNLTTSHPFSLQTPLVDSPDVSGLLFATPPKTANAAVNLVNGSIECTTCHEPHFQNIDKVLTKFMVIDSSSGALCLACHDPNRVVQGQTNDLNGWTSSIHATSTAGVQNLPYATLGQNACLSCHTSHNAPGAEWLLRGAGDQACLTCHSSSNAPKGSTTPRSRVTLAPKVSVSPALAASLDVASEYAKIGHPMSSTSAIAGGAKPASATATRTTGAQGKGLTADNPGLQGCTGCHNPHSVQEENSFSAAPAIRASQRAVVGVSEKDGVTLLKPAREQFQACLRCHGPSSGRVRDSSKYGYRPLWLSSAGDPLDLIPQLRAAAKSSHPVMHDRSSAAAQPSLRNRMLNLDGATPGRSVGVRILCTDCHNSDDNREFGGKGPNGPHGSKYNHILERRYEMSQATKAGAQITNTFPNPDLTVSGPYAMCAKCHDLGNVLSNASFKQHALHIGKVGASCSTCHTGHGVSGASTGVPGERLVNFDVNVVAPNGASPIVFNQATMSCTLTCHNHPHGK